MLLFFHLRKRTFCRGTESRPPAQSSDTGLIKNWCHCLGGMDWVIRKLMTTHFTKYTIFDFYRAMHFSAKRGIAIACRHSVRLSVCLSSQVKSSLFFSIAEQSTLLNYTTQNYTVKYTQLHTTSLYNKVHD